MHAAAPESCFSFNSATGTITGYYDNESNDTSQPACPREVEIPGIIGGVTVTAIGYSSLSNKQLVSVVIPDSVVSID